MECLECKTEMIKKGIHINKKGKFQRYFCTQCGRTKIDFRVNLKIKS